MTAADLLLSIIAWAFGIAGSLIAVAFGLMVLGAVAVTFRDKWRESDR